MLEFKNGFTGKKDWKRRSLNISFRRNKTIENTVDDQIFLKREYTIRFYNRGNTERWNQCLGALSKTTQGYTDVPEEGVAFF